MARPLSITLEIEANELRRRLHWEIRHPLTQEKHYSN